MRWIGRLLFVGLAGTSLAFAETSVPKDFIINITRGTCEGTCPGYSVRLDSQGSVQWDGRKYVQQLGPAKKIITQIQLQSIVQRINDLQFLSFDRGGRDCIDTPTVQIEITMNGKNQSVIHDSCSHGKESQQTAQLAQYVEKMIGTEQWIGKKGK